MQCSTTGKGVLVRPFKMIIVESVKLCMFLMFRYILEWSIIKKTYWISWIPHVFHHEVQNNMKCVIQQLHSGWYVKYVSTLSACKNSPSIPGDQWPRAGWAPARWTERSTSTQHHQPITNFKTSFSALKSPWKHFSCRSCIFQSN